MLARADDIVDRFLDFEVRHHLAADLAEAREAVSDPDEALVVDDRDVARYVPAVVDDLGTLFGLPEVSSHATRRLDQQQTFLVRTERLHGGRIDDARRDARK